METKKAEVCCCFSLPGPVLIFKAILPSFFCSFFFFFYICLFAQNNAKKEEKELAVVKAKLAQRIDEMHKYREVYEREMSIEFEACQVVVVVTQTHTKKHKNTNTKREPERASQKKQILNKVNTVDEV